jgi:hypothetical protein
MGVFFRCEMAIDFAGGQVSVYYDHISIIAIQLSGHVVTDKNLTRQTADSQQ